MSDSTQQQVMDYLLAENGTFLERKSFRMAIKLIDKLIDEQQAEVNALKTEVSELKSELNCRNNTISELEAGLKSANKYKDKLTTAVHVLIDQLKSGKVSGVAIYDVDVLLGDL